MALIHVNFFSQTLGVMSALDVILPEPPPARKYPARPLNKRYPTLFLLHGHSDDHTVWQRRTSIERYVEGAGLAVVMPAVNLSFYADMVSGAKYWTYVSEELPYLVRSLFPLSEKREDTFVAGLSMGGYGAFKLALRCPQKFAAAASLSGALDMRSAFTERDENWQRQGRLIWGGAEEFTRNGNDLFDLATRLVGSAAPQPRLFAWCGSEDFLIEHNRRFRDHCRQLGLPLDYRESPGDHQWRYWDEHIQAVLQWLGFLH